MHFFFQICDLPEWIRDVQEDNRKCLERYDQKIVMATNRINQAMNQINILKRERKKVNKQLQQCLNDIVQNLLITEKK